MTMASLEKRLETLEMVAPGHRRHGWEHRDVRDMSSEELAFETLEMYAEIPTDHESWVSTRDLAAKAHETRPRGLPDYIADDDPRLSDPLDFWISDELRGLLGRFHDKVKDPSLILERYRGRFRDRVLQAAYYAAWHHQSNPYSPAVRAKLEQLAGLKAGT
jgi:hypothetical protein